MPTFARVQEILNDALLQWQTRTGQPPIIAKHDPKFGWSTREQLLASVAFGLPLITKDDIAQKRGDKSNLVTALRTGVAPYPRMPRGGPYLAETDIQEIVDWINDGAP